jgi:hypothetical protein
MRPDDLLALSWALYRLQLSAAKTAAAWWTVGGGAHVVDASRGGAIVGPFSGPDGPGD